MVFVGYRRGRLLVGDRKVGYTLDSGIRGLYQDLGRSLRSAQDLVILTTKPLQGMSCMDQQWSDELQQN